MSSTQFTLTPSSGYRGQLSKPSSYGDGKNLPTSHPLPVPTPNQPARRQTTNITTAPVSNMSTPTKNNSHLSGPIESRFPNIDLFNDGSYPRGGASKQLPYYEGQSLAMPGSKSGTPLLPPRPQSVVNFPNFMGNPTAKASDMFVKGLPQSLGPNESQVAYNSSHRGSRDEIIEIDRLRRDLSVREEEIRKLRNENDLLRSEVESAKTTARNQSNGLGFVGQNNANNINKLVLDEYEDKLHVLFQDMRGLDRKLSETSNVNSNLSKENEMLRGTLRNFEQSMMKMLGELRAYYEGKLKQMDEQLNTVSLEAREFRAKSKTLGDELEHLKTEFAKCAQEAEITKKWSGELSVKHFVTSVEFERVTRLYSDKIAEFEDLKTRFIDACAQYEAVKRSSEVSLKEQLDRQRMNYEGQLKHLSDKVVDLEKNGNTLNVENKKLKGLVDELTEKETELLRTKRMLDDISRQQMELLGELERCKKANMALEALKPRFDAERASLEAQILQATTSAKEMDQQCGVQYQEIQRLQGALKDKTKDLEALQTKLSEMERGSFQEMENMRSQVEAYKKANLAAREMSLKFGVEKSNFEREVAQYRQAIDNNNLELAKLNDLIETFKIESEQMKSELEQARQQAYNFNNQRTTLENEKSRLNDTISNLKQELLVATTARDNYKMELERSGFELSRKNQELQRKLQELEHVQHRIFEINPGAGQFPTPPTQMSENAMYGGRENQPVSGGVLTREKRSRSIQRLSEMSLNENPHFQGIGASQAPLNQNKYGGKYPMGREDSYDFQNNNNFGLPSLAKYNFGGGMGGGFGGLGFNREHTTSQYQAGFNIDDQN